MEKLTVNKLTKKYGQKVILDNLSFQLAPAKIYGLLGRNGAGKSTLLNLITNRVLSTSGEIKIGSHNINDDDHELGKMYLMSEVDMYTKRTTIKRMMELADEAYEHFDFKNAEQMLTDFKLDQNEIFTNLSTGQRTAAKLVVALNVNADYILLDEPVLGLDANHRELFYKELIKAFQNKPRTFVLSTHLIEEIQQLVEHVIIINDHQIIEDADVESLLKKAYAISGPAKDVDTYTDGLNVLYTETMGSIKTTYVFDGLDEQRVIPDRVKIDHYDLQHLFIYLTNGDEQHD
ncbi:ABC superfamily ATP binding cassette transporter ABC protein [Limosilactobacillus frumenti DSM 13145]|uniref:ABC superfamily ATP binding cassette transporter ABC protein n=1 Tax=Limosilactobacillus frumenti DSM 13145 TaxID=1423746 RepID=A0A0R1PHF3_9LACO|nr:ABC transporter ATP-binding protein [Limosilactobacillus frumenti]KRL28315.1 ABC superfamily ATP binding cassette transporter ABC protein [Limosilactobacillus frumenti DSM 13145]MBA2914648.1 ABC transporter ATP-binding protein [Limosilactobacillus frumenti]QFG72931.1 ABC transporter ATP-binding protein [Limosilactobacillus frumenti]